MKICILTQPLHTNYGGLLQAYALQRILVEMGHKVWTEDRRTNSFGLFRRIVRSAPVRRFLGLKPYLAAEQWAVIAQYTQRFVEQNINTTHPIYGTDKSSLEPYDFDAYVVGSDQVWRKEYSEGIENYFLDFAPDSARKVAYAASFGLSAWEFSAAQTARLARLAKRFDMISVRERDGVELCQHHLGVDAHLVLDPVLLLRKEDYKPLVEQDMGYQQQSSTGGVVSYLLDPTPSKISAVQNFAATQKMDVSEVSHSIRDNIDSGVAAQQRIVPPLSHWLSSFSDCAFVLTDSYHGMLLSILFRKPFVVFVNAERGASRFLTLLSALGLNERLVKNPETFDQTVMLQSIDYDAVDAQLEQLREQSLELLRNSLS